MELGEDLPGAAAPIWQEHWENGTKRGTKGGGIEVVDGGKDHKTATAML